VAAQGYEWIKAQVVHRRPRAGIPPGEGQYLVKRDEPRGAELNLDSEYPVMEETGLFKRFAETEPTYDGVLGFANKYGMLGGKRMRFAVSKKIDELPLVMIAAERLELWSEEILEMRH